MKGERERERETVSTAHRRSSTSLPYVLGTVYTVYMRKKGYYTGGFLQDTISIY